MDAAGAQGIVISSAVNGKRSSQLGRICSSQNLAVLQGIASLRWIKARFGLYANGELRGRRPPVLPESTIRLNSRLADVDLSSRSPVLAALDCRRRCEPASDLARPRGPAEPARRRLPGHHRPRQSALW